LIFRLSIILLGALSLWLGYRLLAQAGQHAELSGKPAGSGFMLKHAAPAMFFALFGAFIVIVALAGKPPEFKPAPVAPVAAAPTQTPIPPAPAGTASAGPPSVLAASGDEPKLEDATAPKAIRMQVWKHYELALRQAKRAMELDINNAEFRDTLASLYFMDNKLQEAASEQQRAMELAVVEADKAKYAKRLRGYLAALN